ncbi:MAG: hypothetical protein IJ186_04795 [Bacilli bacterium]|nr:hypothetical protein [Bacilli bacterium]
MKFKKHVFLLPFVALATSCTITINVDDLEPEEDYEIHEVKVDHYNISYVPFLNEDPESLTFEGEWKDFKTKDQFTFCYLGNDEEVPYVSLDTYISLLSKDFKENISTSTTEEGSSSILEIKNGENKLVSYRFDRSEKKVTRSPGSLEGAIKPANKLKNSVTDYIQMNEEVISNANSDFVYSWACTGFKTFTYNEKNYFPLSLLDLQISKDTGRYLLYVGGLKSIYEVCDVAQYVQVALSMDINGTSSYRKASDFLGENYGKKFFNSEKNQVELPRYLTSYNRDAFYYVMDNFYGLGETIGYKSMAKFIDNTVYAEQMLSPEGGTRAEAYSYVCSILNDGHTGFSGCAAAAEGTGLGIAYSQTLLNDRNALNNILRDRRTAELEKAGPSTIATDVRYSTDGKTAYFSFDEFKAVVYDPAQGLNDSDKYDDTYLLFLRNLNEIKAKGGVKNVVIDDSINGGGYVGQLCKLLCLLSKDNSSTIYFRNRENNSIGKVTSKVDVNLDGKIDENDKTFGNDFKFFLVTSSYSFSCGNALPCYCRDLQLAGIVGSKTGGGECIVGFNQLPYASSVTHSSNTHLGYYDETQKIFYGYESGAAPTIAFSGNYYDVDAVASKLG